MPTRFENLMACRRNGWAYLKDCRHLSFNEVHASRASHARDLIRDIGITYDIENEEGLCKDTPCIYVCNHASYLDPLIFCGVFDCDLRFMVKSPLFLVPMLGKALKLEKHIPVHRGSHKKSSSQLLKQSIAETIKDGGSVFFFPEGTRTHDGKMGPFKLGAFFNAIQNGVPIIPIVVKGTFELMPRTTFSITPGHCKVRVLPMMKAPENIENERERAAKFSEEVHQAMENALADWN